MGISMTLEELAKNVEIKKETEVNLYFDKDHKKQVSKDDAKIIERYEFDDDGKIINKETIKKK